MKVYILEVGSYDQAYIKGVYSSPEAAMAAHQPKGGAVRGHEYGSHAGEPWDYEWHAEGDRWFFGADWGDAADIQAYEVG